MPKLIPEIGLKAHRIFSEITTHCTQKDFIQKFKEHYPDDYQRVVDKYISLGHSDIKLDMMVNAHFKEIIEKRRQTARNAINQSRETRSRKKDIRDDVLLIRQAKDLEALKPYSKSSDNHIRMAVARALSKFDSPEARNMLLKLKRDYARIVREQAVKSLGNYDKMHGKKEEHKQI